MATIKVAATAARAAMTVKQVVATARVEQGAEPFGGAVVPGPEVGLEVASIR